MRYNIIVMPSSRDSMREYSFSKFMLVFLGTLFSLIVVGAIVSIVGGIIIYNQKQKVILEKQRLTEENVRLEGYMENYIKRLHKMDQKIRSVFFGSEQQEKAKTDSNSNGLLGRGGGFNPNLPENIEEADSDPIMDFKTKSFDEAFPLIEKIKIVEDSIKEVYEFAVDKEKEINCTPSINPIQAEKGKYWFSSEFGWRIHPLTGKREFHRGLDIAARTGTEVFSPADGEIILIKEYNYSGKTVKIKHDSKYTTFYYHLNDYADGLEVGKKVKRGDPIGYVGESGRQSTGPHLHYEVHVNGKAQNPMKYILDLK